MAEEADCAGALVAHRPAAGGAGFCGGLLAAEFDVDAGGGGDEGVSIPEDDGRLTGDGVGGLVVFDVGEGADGHVVAEVGGGALVVSDHDVALDGGVDDAGLVASADEVGGGAELDDGLFAREGGHGAVFLAPPDQGEGFEDQELSVVLADVVVGVDPVSAVGVVVEVVGLEAPVGGSEGCEGEGAGFLLGAGFDPSAHSLRGARRGGHQAFDEREALRVGQVSR